MKRKADISNEPLPRAEKINFWLTILPIIGGIIFFLLIAYPDSISNRKHKELETIANLLKDPVGRELASREFPKYKDFIDKIDKIEQITRNDNSGHKSIDSKIAELIKYRKNFISQQKETQDDILKRILQVNINTIDDKIEKLRKGVN